MKRLIYRGRIVLLWMLLLVVSGCTVEPTIEIGKIETGDVFERLITDKARYNPGDPVQFTLTLTSDHKAKIYVRYKHLNETVKEETLDINGNQLAWTWIAPSEDFTGYMIEAFLQKDGKIIDQINTAVDVSSDWGKFPRYGYLADFPEMKAEERVAIIDRLNRFHINGIQFYDWQYKHHIPIKWENGQPAPTWPDIANRTVSFETVKHYIELAHDKNMKAMNYNLLFGAYDNAEVDGVKKEWGLFKDPLGKYQDQHPLPDSWASDINLLDPSNVEWQEYLFREEKKVFEVLPFDGWHVDQLGDRGSRWNHNGKSVNLAMTYTPFLENAKKVLDVDFVMNAVGQYGQAFIAPKAPVKFLYTEVWDGHPTYRNLKDIVDQNWKFSKGQLNTVFAAYMNYDLSNSPGEFNTPGVLLTNAVIFASGGSHLELGENMLSKEYFPHKNLQIPDTLEKQLVYYYDVLVAYENLLRDGAEEIELEMKSEDIAISSLPEKGKVWSFAKQKKNKTILQLINFTDAVHMAWNDTRGTQAEPQEKEQVKLSFQTDKKVKTIWMATPDFYQGSAIDLSFEQKNSDVTFVLPKLKYWNMVVIEYE